MVIRIIGMRVRIGAAVCLRSHPLIAGLQRCRQWRADGCSGGEIAKWIAGTVVLRNRGRRRERWSTGRM